MEVKDKEHSKAPGMVTWWPKSVKNQEKTVPDAPLQWGQAQLHVDDSPQLCLKENRPGTLSQRTAACTGGGTRRWAWHQHIPTRLQVQIKDVLVTLKSRSEDEVSFKRQREVVQRCQGLWGTSARSLCVSGTLRFPCILPAAPTSDPINHGRSAGQSEDPPWPGRKLSPRSHGREVSELGLHGNPSPHCLRALCTRLEGFLWPQHVSLEPESRWKKYMRTRGGTLWESHQRSLVGKHLLLGNGSALAWRSVSKHTYF